MLCYQRNTSCLAAMNHLKPKHSKSSHPQSNPSKHAEEDELDRAFLKLAEIVFGEWNSEEDEAAFRDL